MGNTDLHWDSNRDWLAEITEAASGNLPRAIALAHQAKDAGVSAALVQHLLAIELQHAGRFEEAIIEAGHGLQLAPSDAGLTTTVGFCLLELGRRQEAAQVFEAAMKLDPSSSEATYGYGWAAERLGALEAAESAFKRAIVLNPGHADALAGLSGLAARRRDWQASGAYAVQALALNPEQTDAAMNLARVEIGEARHDSAVDRLTTLISLPALKPIARANAHLMLGDALDGAARYVDAFDAYCSGKSELRSLYANEFAGGDKIKAIDSVNRLRSEFDAAPASAWVHAPTPTAGSNLRGHAFLVGFPRSGTTLLEQVLETHPDITTLGERPVMIDAEAEFLTRPGGLARLGDVVDSLLVPYREAYWRRVKEFGVEPAGKVFIDKHPLGSIRLPLISKVFPDAKIIFAIRDPRDVVLSCFRRSFNMNPSMYEFTDLECTARFYDCVMSAAEDYLSKLPLRVFKVRYEDLVADFDTVSSALCDFLDVPRTGALRRFAETARARMIGTPSSVQVGRDLYDEGVDQWRRYAFALEAVKPILTPWIETFGYSPS